MKTLLFLLVNFLHFKADDFDYDDEALLIAEETNSYFYAKNGEVE